MLGVWRYLGLLKNNKIAVTKALIKTRTRTLSLAGTPSNEIGKERLVFLNVILVSVLVAILRTALE